jgi:hypothetical protein
MLPWFTANIFWPKLFFKNDEAKATGIQIFAETVPLRWLPSTIPVRISYRATYRRGRSSVTRNCNNLIRIQALTSQENENEAGTTEKYFVSSVLLSNTMSLPPK